MISELNETPLSQKVLAYFCIFLLSLNNTLISVNLAGITLDRLLEMMVFIVLLPYFFKELLNNQSFYIFTLIILLMIFLRTLMVFFDVSNSSINFEVIIRDIIRVLIFLIFYLLAHYSFSKLGNQGVTFFLIITSPYVLLAFIQHPLTPFSDISYSIHQNFYSGNMVQDITSTGSYLEQFAKAGFLIRPSGPYGGPIILSYALIPIMALSLYAYVYQEKKIYYFWFLCVLMVSFLTLTRSLILGSAFMFLSITFIQLYLKRDRYILFIFLFLLVPVVMLISGELETFNRIFSLSDVFNQDGLSERQVAWLSGFIALIENPVYFNADHYLEIFSSFCSKSSNCMDFISMHNGFLRVGRDFSLFGLIIYLGLWSWIFYVSLKQLFPYNILFISFFVAYLTNTMFHNNTLFISEYAILVPIALLFFFDKSEPLDKKHQQDIILK